MKLYLKIPFYIHHQLTFPMIRSGKFLKRSIIPLRLLKLPVMESLRRRRFPLGLGLELELLFLDLFLFGELELEELPVVVLFLDLDFFDFNDDD